MDNQVLQIANQAPSNTGQDLAKLRQQGMDRIQQFAPNTWTDHNRFDPGVTLLEVLVYVLSDLSYKLDYSVPELLAQASPSGSVKFYEPEQVLFSHCVTADDYRRLILDLPDVKNVHVATRQSIDASTNIIDFKVLLYTPDENKKMAVTEQLNRAFAKARCVNHTLGNVMFYDISKVNVGMTLSLKHVDDLVALLVEIYTLIGREISPDVSKYSAQQLLQMGLKIDDIYQGPRPQHGFVLDKDLNKSAYSVRLFSSNILSVLHEHEHIEQVNAFHFVADQNGSNYNAQEGYEFWQIQFGSDDNSQIVNIAELGFDEANFFNELALLIDGQPYQLTDAEKAAIRAGLQGLKLPPLLTANSMLPRYQSAEYLGLSEYRSLQHELPQVYAVTEQTLDGHIESEQKAQLLQFKGYLQLFDQILADQHKQLDVLPDILSLPQASVFEGLGKLLDRMLASESLNEEQVSAFWQQVCALPHTQLSQALTGISGIEHLLDTASLTYWQRGMQLSLESDFSIAQLTRLNQSAQHLLARFAERAVDGNLLKYKAVFAFYAPSLEDARDPNPQESLLERLVLLRQYIDKCRLLNEIGILGENRCQGYDYLANDIQQSQCSSMAKGIMRRLGLSHPAHMPLAIHNRESFYLVEGSLVEAGMPQGDELDAAQRMQLSRSLYFVLPDWTTRFASLEFRQFTERKIRELTPLHMSVHCLWLDRETMSLFERLYYGWLNYFSQTQKVRFTDPNESLSEVLKTLSEILGGFLTSQLEPLGPMIWLTLLHKAGPEGHWDDIKDFMVGEMKKHYTGTSPIKFEKTDQSLSSIYQRVETIIKEISSEEGEDKKPVFPADIKAYDIFQVSARAFYQGLAWSLADMYLSHQAKLDDQWDDIKIVMSKLLGKNYTGEKGYDLAISGETSHDIYLSIKDIIDSQKDNFPDDFGVDDVFYLSAEHYTATPFLPLEKVILTRQKDLDESWDVIKTVMVEQLRQFCGIHRGENGQIDYHNFVVEGDDFYEIYESVVNIILSTPLDDEASLQSNTHFPEGFSADDIFYLTAQHFIDEICRPSISDQVKNKKGLTIGYSPLPYLKPLYPISTSNINSNGSHPYTFIVAHSKPNRI